MELDEIISTILSSYGIDFGKMSIQRIDSGHINNTFKIEPGYILQRINKNVFVKPDILSGNLRAVSNYLKKNVPDYLFLNAIENEIGEDVVYDKEGHPWRLFPYFKNTITINEVANASQAFDAAKAFAQLSKHLTSCDITEFEETIPQFHNLSLRFLQFEQAVKTATADRLGNAKEACKTCNSYSHLVLTYKRLVEAGDLKLRITHNDTKINNVLFDKDSNKVVCVIDLDTLMPGYFIYDLGDMIRTYVSPVSEEEIDLSKIVVRKEIHNAILEGYLSEMGEILSTEEKAAIPLAGPIMIYMIGLRFLTDYLNGDIYFRTTYPDQNLNRAINQFHLLEKLLHQGHD